MAGTHLKLYKGSWRAFGKVQFVLAVWEGLRKNGFHWRTHVGVLGVHLSKVTPSPNKQLIKYIFFFVSNQSEESGKISKFNYFFSLKLRGWIGSNETKREFRKNKRGIGIHLHEENFSMSKQQNKCLCKYYVMVKNKNDYSDFQINNLVTIFIHSII